MEGGCGARRASECEWLIPGAAGTGELLRGPAEPSLPQLLQQRLGARAQLRVSLSGGEERPWFFLLPLMLPITAKPNLKAAGKGAQESRPWRPVSGLRPGCECALCWRVDVERKKISSSIRSQGAIGLRSRDPGPRVSVLLTLHMKNNSANKLLVCVCACFIASTKFKLPPKYKDYVLFDLVKAI